MINDFNKNLNLIFVYIGVFSFFFLWDINLGIFNLRYLIVLPIFTLIFYSFKEINFKNIIFYIFFPLLITFHFLILSYYFKYEINLRDCFGLIFLFITFIVFFFNRSIIKANLDKILNLFIVFFSISFLIYFIFSETSIVLNCYDGWFFRNQFVYIENSHFAIISVPIINYYLIKFFDNQNQIKNNKILFLFFVIFLIISFINFSTTFLVGLILTNLFILIKKYKNLKFIVVSFFLIFSSLLIILNYKQCTDRSLGSLKKIKEFYEFKKSSIIENMVETEIKEKLIKYRFSMSVETFIVSLEITNKSFFDKPFGVGFNKYYLSHKEYINQIMKTDNQVKKNNIYDGSTNISKLITEFGLFGILLLLMVFFYYLKIKKINNTNIFILSLIFMQLLRGVGYFNGGFLLAIMLLFSEFNIFKKYLIKN